MKILNKDNFVVLLLFISFLYSFIHVEGGSGQFVFLMQSTFLMLITFISLYINNFKLNMNILGKISLYFLFFFILLSMLISNGGRQYTMIISIIFSFITASAIHYNQEFKNQFLIALKSLIIFSILLLIIQLLVFNITENIIKFHDIFYPFSEARIGVDKLFEGLYRFGGLYIEPGTYSNWLYLFLIIYMILSQKIFTPLVLIGSLSMILSFSVWGMVFGTYLFLIVIITKIKSSSLKSKFLILVFFLSFSYYVINQFTDNSAVKFAIYKLDVDSNNTSTSGKIDFYKKYQSNLTELLFVGEGYKPSIYKGIGSPQDTGFLINLSVVFGIFFTLTIFTLFAFSLYKCCGWIMLIIFLPVATSKIYFSDPVFWLLYFLVIYSGFYNYKNINTNKKYLKKIKKEGI